MEFDSLDYTVTEGRAEVVLDRPDVLNAFDSPMIDELNEALERAHDDEEVYVVLLTGAGRGFCSGADVSDMGGERDRTDSTVRLFKVQNVVRKLLHGEKPVVGAINGPALGAGCDFALACDLRVMGEEAYLREQFVNIGLVPGDGGAWLLPRLVGEAKAKELVMTGRDVGPEEAVDLGLAVETVPTDEVMHAGRDIANTLRDKPATAMRETKALFEGTATYDDYAQAAIEGQRAARDDPEHTEAVTALREGRDPDFDRPY
ncbi:MAG: enoyl-CoA hydratase-related protein [Haloarculaceae archaeon]